MRFLSIAIVISVLVACNNSDKNRPDVSKIKVDIKIERFEQSFFTIDTNNLPAGLQQVNAAYPNFTSFYLPQILGVNPKGNSDTVQLILKQIISGYKPVNESIQKKYPDLNWLKKDLTE